MTLGVKDRERDKNRKIQSYIRNNILYNTALHEVIKGGTIHLTLLPQNFAARAPSRDQNARKNETVFPSFGKHCLRLEAHSVPLHPSLQSHSTLAISFLGRTHHSSEILLPR